MSEGFNTTVDAFLGGQVMLEQPAKGYRAGIDPVLLAASVPAIEGQSVLELGCGTGAAMLCLGKRVQGLTLFGAEIQPHYAELCRKNAAANGIDAQISTADLRALPQDITARTFDHVITNPPYFERTAGKASPRADRDIAFAGDTSMKDWLDAATRRLKPKGWLSMIQKADRLPDVLNAIDTRLGDVAVYPISGRINRPADRFILRTRKGTRGPFKLHAPIALHEGEIHVNDQPDYRSEVADVLRQGFAFSLPD
ncbi:tRNA1(Val) (adenine(37)-N6)-methyltransferase [Octadecabacter ascidiaceicola]|uniref:N5-glutamine S-adenosyl-L-methionine-dependent methyltransferase n=1 Tax=Octadecabacter ascidiaceicola TaxID=1655543 RepID=A0A238KIY2_9RHOB|nr:methyltransferase domain-containing protein [Octadecabacter ascidiaceicola]SMX42721.1 N5-glutamine S-adenosyl-L-methionine-dependent methyltransferase [Octadecabacter ascidiaceicola]